MLINENHTYPTSLINALDLTTQRLNVFPDSPFFLYAKRDLEKVSERLLSHKPIDTKFYKSLKVGVMCARELETSDMQYCDLIYQLLDDIRPVKTGFIRQLLRLKKTKPVKARLTAEEAERIARNAAASSPLASQLTLRGIWEKDEGLFWHFWTPTKGSSLTVEVEDETGNPIVKEFSGR